MDAVKPFNCFQLVIVQIEKGQSGETNLAEILDEVLSIVGIYSWIDGYWCEVSGYSIILFEGKFGASFSLPIIPNLHTWWVTELNSHVLKEADCVSANWWLVMKADHGWFF